MLRLTRKQRDILIQVVCDEIDQIEDYIRDGTYGDHDQEELDSVTDKTQELRSILEDLKEE